MPDLPTHPMTTAGTGPATGVPPGAGPACDHEHASPHHRPGGPRAHDHSGASPGPLSLADRHDHEAQTYDSMAEDLSLIHI